jgi:hypothetical protein
MGDMLKASEVFRVNGLPDVTYVDRSEEKLESLLHDAFEVPDAVISVSGPSKTGKTVLITKTVDPSNLIEVSGASIREPVDLWKHTLAWMASPTDIIEINSGGEDIRVSADIRGNIKVPLVADGGIKAQAAGTTKKSSSTQTSKLSNYFNQVIREIANSEFVVFIDDFHYIPRDIQSDIARQIKAIAERGVKICTASVPHRSDDVVRGNPELRGRLVAVDCTYWSEGDLRKIASQGFEALNIDIARGDVERLVLEACGSPQLMQTLCLNLCLEMDAKERPEDRRSISVAESEMTSVLSRASMFADYSTLLEKLHGGPKQRGTERKIFSLNDQSSGDVYRTVLLAISQDPAEQTLRYENILARVKSLTDGVAPVGSSISEALRQMEAIAKTVAPDTEIFEWDEEVLNIIEPYFLFYLRCSSKLATLAGTRQE